MEYVTNDNQSAAKALSSNEYGKGSETIPKGSTSDSCPSLLETESTLIIKIKGEDIVQNKNIKRTKLKFLERAHLKYNGKFDYSKIDYVNYKTRCLIICPNHGEFYQTPDKHLAPKAHGCPMCWNEQKKVHSKSRLKGAVKGIRYVTEEQFLLRANAKYNNLYTYDLTDYDGLTGSKIGVICKLHGTSLELPTQHLSKNVKYGCAKCRTEGRRLNQTQSYDKFLEKANKLYDNFYSYPESNRHKYVNTTSKVDIICPLHGLFIKGANKHLDKTKQACFKCKTKEMIDRGVLPGGYCEDLFNDKPELKDKEAILYYIVIDEKYFKVGITVNKISSRFSSLKGKAKGAISKMRVIYKKTDTLYNVYKLEQEILNTFSDKRIIRDWSTELFSEDISKSVQKYFI